jgi:AICAR transformylase/IMP cyclohydrolase PurH
MRQFCDVALCLHVNSIVLCDPVCHAGTLALATRCCRCSALIDAFFPFADGLNELIKIGVKCIIQPGGSIKDDEVIAAAEKSGIAMVFTGIRNFRH